jgi:excisionase family DNA binding protein
MPLDDYLTVIEAARRLGIHPDTVKRLCRQGDIPAVKLRNTWLVDRETLEVFAGTYQPKRGGKKRLI